MQKTKNGEEQRGPFPVAPLLDLAKQLPLLRRRASAPDRHAELRLQIIDTASESSYIYGSPGFG
jgi:hypothetical protein